MKRHEIKRVLRSLGNTHLRKFGVDLGFLRKAKLSVREIPDVQKNGFLSLVIEWQRKDYAGNLRGGQILIPA